MTETPMPVRATARVGENPTRPGGTPTLVPRRRTGYLGPLHAVQLMAIEAVIVGILVLLGHGIVAVIAGTVFGLLLLAVVLGRRGGRWWLERTTMGWQFRRRNASKPVRPLPDQRLASMQFLAPGLTIDDVASPDGSSVGVAGDDAGWYAVAAIGSGGAMYDDGRPMFPLDRLVTALADPDRSGRAVVQLVTHTVPVPEPVDAIGESYHRLLARHEPSPVPADRVTWLAVRLDARDLAEMGAEQAEQAPVMVASLLRHLVKTLRRTGVATRALDRDALLDALARSCDLVGDVESPSADPHEDWDAWYSGRLVHRTYWLQHWPSISQCGPLLDRLSTVPAALTSIAVMLAPGRDTVDIRCLARVATTPNRIAAVSRGMQEQAHAAGAKLLTLDGEQGPAAYATAPTGGGPR
ncbi:MAG TPA: type VII secretion protein EccE [Micromonosporaceae bacterium]